MSTLIETAITWVCRRPGRTAVIDPPREGDVVAFLRMGTGGIHKVIPAVIVRWSGDPDSHALLVDVAFGRSRRYVDGLLTVGATNAAGEVLLPQWLADEAREKITAYLATDRGERLLEDGPVPQTQHWPQGVGSPLPWEVPTVLHDRHTQTWHPRFERYLDFWCEGYPRALEALRQRNESQWMTFVAVHEHGWTVAELARYWHISVHTVYSWRRRALLFMQSRLDRGGDWQADGSDSMPGVA